jgi:tRNA modification GTPase
VIRAQTATGLAVAQSQLGGWLAQEVRRIRAALMDVLAYVTVVVDFPEDEVEMQDVTPALTQSLRAVERLLATADQGMVYRQGARAALVGRPNAGKSSLLNALLRADRAIVTAIPGTTRDTLEETANLAGIPVVLIDTAGITASSDPVERLGVDRSRAALAAADLALLLLDSSRPPTPEDIQMAEITLDKPTLLVWSKIDQRLEQPSAELPTLPFAHPYLLGSVATSVVTGAGIDDLARAVAQALLGGQAVVPGNAQLVSNPRHRDALDRAVNALQAAVAGQTAGVPTDLLAGDLTTAMNALGEITGETVGEDLLDTIFSRFCIGK